MPENPSIFQQAQLGLETVPGTLTSASKRLLATGMVANPQIPGTPYGPAGSWVPTTVIRQKEWTTAAIDGRMAFNDLCYLLAAHYCLPVITTPATATLTRRWTFKPNNFSLNTIQTYTVERGTADFGTRFGYALVNSLQFRMTDTESAVTGEFLGKGTNEPFTMTTTGLTDVPLKEIGPMQFDVLVGTSVGSLTQLDRDVEAQLTSQNLYNRIVTLDSREPSFSGLVPVRPTLTLQLVMEHNAVSQAYLANLRAVDTLFVRIVATGSIIETTFPYRLQITTPVKLANPTFGDHNGMWAATYNAQMIYDATFASFIEVVIDTPMVSL